MYARTIERVDMVKLATAIKQEIIPKIFCFIYKGTVLFLNFVRREGERMANTDVTGTVEAFAINAAIKETDKLVETLNEANVIIQSLSNALSVIRKEQNKCFRSSSGISIYTSAPKFRHRHRGQAHLRLPVRHSGMH